MDKIDEVLTRGVSEVLPSRDGLKKLMREKKITLYQGFDPTGTQLHIGHAVALRKMRQFQELGHHVIFLIGDGTGQAGDPSGKKTAREKFYTKDELRKNSSDYVMQAQKIVRFDGANPAKILYNSEWLNKLNLVDILDIAGHFSIQQMLERDLYQERLKSGVTLSFREFMYPLLQGYDSVAMNVDLELGGTDQTFNMLAGRTLVRSIQKREKYVLSVPLLSDSLGNKIGKSEGNVIGLTNPPNDFFGKIMSLSDDSIVKCFELLTDVPMNEVNEIKQKIKDGENPMVYKKKLAFELTKQFNSEKDAKEAQEHFEKTFQEKTPTYEQKVEAGGSLANTIAPYTSLASISDAKRLINQGSVDVNEQIVTNPTYKPKSGDRIKIGEKVFIEVK